MRLLLGFLCAGTLLVSSAAAEEARVAIRRFALVAGANDGGPDRGRLRYATSDASAVARVLGELGGVQSDDLTLLANPDRAAFERGIAELRTRMQAARGGTARIELVLYYSGHSDDEGLLLRGERFGYDDLRHALNALPADVRVAVLDSCSSGALTRRKGGARRAPFLVDESAKVRGHAYLTSSSEHEAAQESDRIRASYFTHYLLSGLRGAADVMPDRRVTLNEAYQFAFAETLRQTEKTQAGAQHPAYDIQLAGTGDLVMTDLRTTSASLLLEASLTGRFFVHDADERLAAELYKPAGRAIELGLAPGVYSVRVDDKGALFEADVLLRDGAHVSLSTAELRPVSAELTARRGNGLSHEPAESALPTDSLEALLPLRDAVQPKVVGDYRLVPVSASVLPRVSTAGQGKIIKRVSANLLMGRGARLRGVEVGLGVNWIDEEVRGAQVALGMNHAGTATGVQWAAGGNVTEGALFGAQTATGFNTSGGGHGVQVAAGANIVNGDMRGIQLAAGYDMVRDSMRGIQVAAGVNLTRGPMRGVQLAAGGNAALGGITGVQAAIVNIAGDVHGTQLGLVNIGAKVTGLQLGLVNVADEVTVPIGLVNVVKQGQRHLDLWTSTDEPLSASVRLGGKHVYSLFAAGMARRNVARLGEIDTWRLAFGVGGELSIRDVAFVDIDALGPVHLRYGAADTAGNLARLRVTLGVKIAEHLAIYAGAVENALFGIHDDPVDVVPRSLIKGGRGLWRSGDVTVRTWPGVIVGIRI